MSEREVVLSPDSGGALDPAEIWAYRNLLWQFSLRNLLVLYKQTALGLAWSVVRPLVAVGAFTLVFGRLAGLPSGDVPYPVMVLAGVLPWQFFTQVLQESSGSLVASSGMVSKVYFPRLLLPLSTVGAALADLAVGGVLLALLLAWNGLAPGWGLLLLPLAMGPALMASLGLGSALGALNVRFRDVRYVVPVLVQAGLYLSPVGFQSSVVPERWQGLFHLNPMAGSIEAFRWCVGAASGPPPWAALGTAWLGGALLLAAGLALFSRMERGFADVI